MRIGPFEKSKETFVITTFSRKWKVHKEKRSQDRSKTISIYNSLLDKKDFVRMKFQPLNSFLGLFKHKFH